MSRDTLPNRRRAITQKVEYQLVGGNVLSVLVTFGLGRDHRVREMFCADFKAGSDNQAVIIDACVLVSRLLQHGDTVQELSGRLCRPHSLIGSIVAAAAELDGED